MKTPVSIDSISTFFEISHYQYCVFDMGHKIHRLSKQHFKRIETQQETYPTPFKQEAWLGILFWQPTSNNEPIIWFIHLPVDELGLLTLEARDHFIQQTLEQVGEKIKQDHDSNDDQQHSVLQEQQQSSPFAFKPNAEKMAIFNAFAKKILNQSPSHYYPHVVDYIAGKIGYEQWSFLGIQGIADVIVRLDHKSTREADQAVQDNIINAIPSLPTTPLITFGQMLEHVQSSAPLSNVLLERLAVEVNTEQPNSLLQAALIRALSSAQSNKHRQQAISTVMQHQKTVHIEILAAIASRAWETLNDQQLLKQFLEMSATHPQESFDHLLLSLMTIPTMQAVIKDGLKEAAGSGLLDERKTAFMKRVV